MALVPGTRLGPYQVLSAIGAGGMGEVYRAKDTRLDRTVALKVLPASLASDPDRRQRFEREARAVSSLNHPHICTLHDIGQQDGIDFLVMEYIEGESLSDRLQKGPLPTEAALRYAIEIADALDRAHRQGVVHRDLKPANVMLTKSGAKLLDFGLAKLKGPEMSAGSMLSALPTGHKPLTEAGTLLGTFQYMAPEQLEGKDADARTDIFALGALVYEMATGKRAFEAKSQASLIVAILEHEPPPMASLQPMTPPALERVVRTCLAKDPDERWQSAHDVVAELKWIAEGDVTSATAGARAIGSKGRRALPWIVASACLVAAAIVSLMHFSSGSRFLSRTAGWGVVRFGVFPPAGGALAGTPALSPDGRRMAFVASDRDRAVLFVRALDSLGLRSLAGTEGASANAPPFWSPDSRHIAFFAGGKLKRIDAGGGPVQVLADAPEARGGAWNAGGTILFAPRTTGPLFRLPAAGGTPTAATELDPGRREFSHRWPGFLADGRHFLYWVEADSGNLALGVAGREIQAGSLDDKGVLGRFPSAQSTAVYAAPGYVLFQRGAVLMAQPFDSRKLRIAGDPTPVGEAVASAEGAGMPFGAPGFSVSQNGVLAYRVTERAESRLTWFDRLGRRLAAIGPPALYRNHRLSPDGARVAVARVDPQSDKSDIWILDTVRDAPLRFTLDPGDASLPVWSRDGQRIVFNSERSAAPGLYEKLASGAGTEQMLAPATKAAFPLDWSPDGLYLAFLFSRPETRGDIGVLTASGATQLPIQTAADEVQAQFSPDGRWLAYCSDETGGYEVYVRGFPSSGGKWQVSSGGGYEPRWRGDGKELFYLSSDRKLMAVTVRPRAVFEAGPPTVLFDAQVTGALQGWENSNHYDVTANGQRFLINTPIEGSPASPIIVILDWPAGLER
jgi:eukaryotic-like serine/threonine-protein kinase